MKNSMHALFVGVAWLSALCVTANAHAAGTGSCGQSDCSSQAGDCFCDGSCSEYGDCCADYSALCSAAAGSAEDTASGADILVMRSTDDTVQTIIPGFFTHSALKDYVADNWIHSTGSIKEGLFSCPLGLYGGVKYEPRPAQGDEAVALFHVTNITDNQRVLVDDLAYNHFLVHYPYTEGAGTAWDGDAEQTGVGSPAYCASSSSDVRSNYDWSWVDTRIDDHPYCAALIYWSYSDASVDACGQPLSGAGFQKPLYDHSADFGPNCLWLGEHFDNLAVDVCDLTGGLDGWDAGGHFLGWVQGSHEPNENDVKRQCEAGATVEAITPTDLVENHVDEGYTEGYFTFSYNYSRGNPR